MLVKERCFSLLRKKIFLIFLIFLINSQNVRANVKENIVEKLNSIQTIKFKFTQTSNGISERGVCLLFFPNKLKCNYNDKNQKELIINKTRLAITQKRYNKTYFYSLSKSPFDKILNKDKLIEYIKSSNIKIDGSIIKFNSYDKEGQSLNILFDKNQYNFLGWETTDKFNNNIVFLIDIILINSNFDSNEFDLPKTN